MLRGVNMESVPENYIDIGHLAELCGASGILESGEQQSAEGYLYKEYPLVENIKNPVLKTLIKAVHENPDKVVIAHQPSLVFRSYAWRAFLSKDLVAQLKDSGALVPVSEQSFVERELHNNRGYTSGLYSLGQEEERAVKALCPSFNDAGLSYALKSLQTEKHNKQVHSYENLAGQIEGLKAVPDNKTEQEKILAGVALEIIETVRKNLDELVAPLEYLQKHGVTLPKEQRKDFAEKREALIKKENAELTAEAKEDYRKLCELCGFSDASGPSDPKLTGEEPVTPSL